MSSIFTLDNIEDFSEKLNIDELYEIVQKFLQNPIEVLPYNDNAIKAIKFSQNTSQKIIEKLDEILMLKV
jgi:hypothetical protein